MLITFQTIIIQPPLYNVFCMFHENKYLLLLPESTKTVQLESIPYQSNLAKRTSMTKKSTIFVAYLKLECEYTI